MKKQIILISSFIIIIIINSTRANQISWQHIFGGDRVDIANSVIKTNDNGFLMNGYRWVKEIPTAYLRKYDIKGNTLWEKYLSGKNSYMSTEDDSGNLYVITLIGSFDSKLIKLNFQGEVLWEKRYASLLFGSIVLTNQNRNLVIGGLKDFPQFSTASLTKLDTSGNLIWSKAYYDSLSFGGEYFSSYRSYLVNEENYFFAGEKNNRGYIIKTDTSGNIVWKKIFQNFSIIHSIVKNSQNTFIASGREFCIKFNSNGDTIWTRNYANDTNKVWGFKIIKTHNNNFAIVGSGFYGENRLMIIDSLGNPVLRKKYFYKPENIISSVYICNSTDTSFVVCGFFSISDQHDPDILIFKTDRNANLVNIHQNYSYSEIKSFYINIYPNPFNSTSNIEFNLTQSSNVRIDIYNILGKVVKTITSQRFNAGIHKIKIVTDNLPSGIYFLKTEVLNNIYFKKFILLK